MTTTPQRKIPTPEELRDIYIAAREGASTVDKAKAGLIGVYEAGRAAGLLGGDPTEERPYSGDVAHEYGAWETDDIEEHAFDMLAVVQHRRAAAGVAPREPSPVASAPTVGDDSGHCGDDDRGGREDGPEDEGRSHQATVAGTPQRPSGCAECHRASGHKMDCSHRLAPSPDREKLIAEADELIQSWDARGSWTPDSPVGMVMQLRNALAVPPTVDEEKIAKAIEDELETDPLIAEEWSAQKLGATARRLVQFAVLPTLRGGR